MKDGILMACIVENISTRKDRTVKVVLGTQEMPQAKAGSLFMLQNNLCSVYLKSEGISQDEINLVDKVNPEMESKSQSQRIRNTLYILFTQDNEGHKDFDSFYRAKTELYINHLKSKIQ